MKFKYKLLIAIAPAVLVLDQVTKFWVVSTVEFGSRIPIIPGFFDLVYFQNTGAAFGLFAGAHDGFRIPFFYIVAALAVVSLSFYFRWLDDGERLMPVTLSLIFGGIAGNIVDRVRIGAVVDFLSFHIGDASLDFSLMGRAYHIVLEWPAFNVADSAITVAVFLLLYSAFFGNRESRA